MTNELILNRCQRLLPKGQCPDEALPGTDRCEAHTSKTALRKQQDRNFHVADARTSARLNDLAASEGLFSLKEEIAITRHLGEKMMDALNSDNSEEAKLKLLLQAPMILRIVEILQKLVLTGASLELKLNGSLTKDALYVLADRMVAILEEELSDVPDYQEIIGRITGRFADSIDTAHNTTTD